MWLEMKVKGLALDPLSNMPMIILRDEKDVSLPVLKSTAATLGVTIRELQELV